MKTEDILLLIGGYLVIQKFLGPSYPESTATTPQCPRGPQYTRSPFTDCDANYVQDWWDKCNCLG